MKQVREMEQAQENEAGQGNGAASGKCLKDLLHFPDYAPFP